jgi:subtilisin family serine protease
MMRRSSLSWSAVGVAGLLVMSLAAPANAQVSVGASSVRSAGAEYIVLFKQLADDPQAKDAIVAAGGEVTSVDAALGYAVARSSAADFADKLEKSGKVDGVAPNGIVGVAPGAAPKSDDVEKLTHEGAPEAGSAPTVTPFADSRRQSGGPAAEPLAGLQWDMQQINATSTGSYAVQQGKRGVLVGVIDTGIDGTHPDIAPNFDEADSRNFVTDMPDIDGPCDYPSCVDPVNVDDDGHGTHVASTIGAPINGIGIAGVAPNVTLVNIRAGQDSGYFFLGSTLQALKYAGDLGVDVVNMSYYTDPWLYNCTNNPADSPAEQQEQRVIRQATQRALNYAIARGVLPIAAEGNEATDLNNPTSDDTSPDYPAKAAKPRVINNSCITVPTESNGVISVSSTGPSTRKAYYSNYGTEQTDVAAPGGDTYDTADNTRNIANAILAAYPKNVAEAAGTLNPDGTPNTPSVIRDCEGDVCAYYQYLQGTSMAAPHAVGVAALIVSQFGHSKGNGQIGLSPLLTGAKLLLSANRHACPSPRTYHYTRILPSGVTVGADATCDGSVRKNGFYGTGIVDALRAVKPF